MSTSTWRLRVQLDDNPGVLARLTVHLAARDCNVLALSVLPVPGGVVDELVIAAPAGLRAADLVALIRAEGGRRIAITPARVHDLVDDRASVLRAAARAVENPSEIAAALRTVLGADAVEPINIGSGRAGWGVEAVDAHQFVVGLPDGAAILVRRGWAPFTDIELARAFALVELLRAAQGPPLGPRAVITSDGAGIVLRTGRQSDADAVAALHQRCSMPTLFARYHAGVRTVPRRWLHRLLSPPRGSTVLAVCGHDVIGVGQLIGMTTPDLAEVSLLIEDDWQRKGVGTALLAHLAAMARGSGFDHLIGWCLPAEDALIRTGTRAGLASSVRTEDGLLRVSLDLRTPARTHPVSASTEVSNG